MVATGLPAGYIHFVTPKDTLHCDYLIVGAGLIGSSAAMHLGAFVKGKGASVVTIDADLEGKLSSSELNAGGARATWDQDVNVALSKDSIDFFRTRPAEVGWREVGYLWMFAPEKWAAARERAKRLSRQGLAVAELSVSELQERVPFVDKTEGLAGATFSPRDGLFNPNLLKNIFREEARANGVEFRDGHRVLGVARESNGDFIIDVAIVPPNEEDLKTFLTTKGAQGGERRKIRARMIVNCAGAWSGKLAQMIGYQSEIWPVRRQVSIFSCREVDLSHYGMMIDTSGVYFHPEANNILAGYADPAEPRGFNLNYDGLGFFEEKIWMPLYERSSKFESLKHITGWGGLYEMTPDSNAVIGRAPGAANVFECYGFSGRGAMQSYAAGRGVAELAAFGKYQTLDLSSLDGSRFARGALVPEGLHI